MEKLSLQQIGVSAKSILIAQGTLDSLFPQGASKGNQTYKTDIIKGSAMLNLGK